EVSFLAALRDVLGSAAAALLEGIVTPGLTGRISASQQRFVELRTVARSQQTAFTLMHNDALRRRVTVLGACEQWARELATIALNGARIEAPELATIAGEAAAHAEAALDRLGGGQATSAASAGSGEHVVAPGSDDPDRRAVRLLLRVDAALTRLAAEADNIGVPDGRLNKDEDL